MSDNKFNELYFVLIFLVVVDYAFLCLGLKNSISNPKILELLFMGGFAIRSLMVFFSILNSRGKRLKRMLKDKDKKRISKKTLYSIIGVSALIMIFIPFIPLFRMYVYPASFLLMIGTFTYLSHNYPINPGLKKSEDDEDLFAEEKALDTPKSLPIPAFDGKFVNVYDKTRHTLTIGSTGSGKSFSIGRPIINDSISKGRPGIYYDLKYPEFCEYIYSCWRHYNVNIPLYIFNMVEPKKSHTCNIFKPKFLNDIFDVDQFTKTFFSNLIPDFEKQSGTAKFFIDSAISIFKACIWFNRNRYLEAINNGNTDVKCLCTLPHVIEMCCYTDIGKLIAMLDTDMEVSGIISSIKTTLPKKSEMNDQLTGVLGTLQVNLQNYISKELYYLFNGDDFELNINAKEDPKILIVNSLQGKEDAYGPLVSLVFSTAMSAMNKKDQLDSDVFCDEFQSFKITYLKQLANSCRSNGISLNILTTDISELVLKYGSDMTETLIGLFNNQFWGKANHPKAAKHVSDLFGRHETTVINQSLSASSNTSNSNLNSSKNISHHSVERMKVKPQDVINLKQGEFYVSIAEADMSMYKTRFTGVKDDNIEIENLPILSEDLTDDILMKNFQAVRKEAHSYIESYFDTYKVGKVSDYDL